MRSLSKVLSAFQTFKRKQGIINLVKNIGTFCRQPRWCRKLHNKFKDKNNIYETINFKKKGRNKEKVPWDQTSLRTRTTFMKLSISEFQSTNWWGDTCTNMHACAKISMFCSRCWNGRPKVYLFFERSCR
jgi:hypothetical protein